MNTGIIASRYAKALLLLSKENGSGSRLCAQVISLLADPQSVPSDSLCPELSQTIALLAKNGRTEYLRYVLVSFVGMYRKSEGIKLVRLKTAVDAPELAERLSEILSSKTGCKIEMETSVDTSIIGGFVLEVDDYLLDASISHQLETVRKQFVERNRRIV